MFKLIIFDLDGPILDSLKRSKGGVLLGIKKLIWEGVSPKRTSLSGEVFIKCWGYPGSKTTRLMFPFLTNNELGIITNCWTEHELAKKIPLVKGAITTLQYLKRKRVLTALLTSRSRNLKFHLGDYPLENLFEIVQSWENPKVKSEKIHSNHIFYHHHKPDPRVLNPILKWAAEKGISKKEMLMIDDALVGLETARKVSLKFLGVCTGPLNSKTKWLRYGNLEENYVINSIAELPNWLENYEGAHSSIG